MKFEGVLPLIQLKTSNMTHRWRKFIGFCLLLSVLVVVGYWWIFSRFMFYDDEGSFLLSLNTYFTQGGLYERATSLYGPFFFAFNHLLHNVIGLKFDHDTGRLITLFYWCTAACICGLFVCKQTLSLRAGLAGTILSFVSLVTMIREPMHPSGFITLAVTMAVVLGGVLIIRGKPISFAVMAGLLGTTMVWSKINVGAFFAIATGAWLAINSRAAGYTRAAALLTALGCVLVPLLLMRGQWPSPWATGYALLFTCSALTLTTALYDAGEPDHSLKSWLFGLGVSLIFAFLILAAVVANQTHWEAIWRGVIAVPHTFSQTNNFMSSSWPGGVRELALIQLLVAIAYYLRRRAAWVLITIAALRIAAGVWFFVRLPLLLAEPTAVQDFCFSYGPSLAWLLAIPITSTYPKGANRARLWLAWVLIWQTLQAYPVAGSQMGWGSFLWVPLFAIGWHETIVFWTERLRWPGRLAEAISGWLLTLAAASAIWIMADTGYRRYASNEPLGLPGAQRLRIENNLASDLHVICENVLAHGGIVFTYPAMFSFNLWTGTHPPSFAQATPETHEQVLFDQLESDPRAIVIINTLYFEFVTGRGLAAPETLYRFLNEHFTPEIRVGSYEFWVRRGRQVALFSNARLLPSPSANPLRLELTLDSLPRPAVLLQLVSLTSPHTVLQSLPLDTARSWSCTPIDDSGTATDKASEGSGPVRILGPCLLRVELVPSGNLPDWSQIEVRLLDRDGQILEQGRFTEKPPPLVIPSEPAASN